MKKRNKRLTLHNHPTEEARLYINSNHVIIDRDVFIELIKNWKKIDPIINRKGEE